LLYVLCVVYVLSTNEGLTGIYDFKQWRRYPAI